MSTKPFTLKHLTLLAVWTIVAVLLVNTTPLVLARHPPATWWGASGQKQQLVAKPVVATVPYTVILAESRISVEGFTTPGMLTTYAVRSDGSQVQRFEHLRSANQASQRRIVFRSGETVMMDEIRDLKSTTLDKRNISVQREPTSNCLKTIAGTPAVPQQRLAGEDRVMGYRTIMVVSRSTTSWFAPELGCALLRRRTSSGDGSVNDHLAQTILPGEPDAALFAVPDRFKEVSLSEFYRAKKGTKDAQEWDDYYAAYRVRRYRR